MEESAPPGLRTPVPSTVDPKLSVCARFSVTAVDKRQTSRGNTVPSLHLNIPGNKRLHDNPLNPARIA